MNYSFANKPNWFSFANKPNWFSLRLHSLRVMRTANAVKKRAISSAPPGWTSIRERREDSDISTMSLTDDPGGSASGNSTRLVMSLFGSSLHDVITCFSG